MSIAQSDLDLLDVFRADQVSYSVSTEQAPRVLELLNKGLLYETGRKDLLERFETMLNSLEQLLQTAKTDVSQVLK